MLKYGLLFTASLLASLVLTPAVRHLAIRVGAIDSPDEERRIHLEPTPRLGGVALYVSILLTFLLAFIFDRLIVSTLFGYDWQVAALGAGASVVLLLGVIDDFRSLSPGAKLVTQILAGLAVVASGYRIQVIGGLDLGFWGLPLTLLWVVSITNAFNLVDGLDGLAAGVGVIVSATLFSLALYAGEVASALILAVLAGALLGFLRYNFYPATIFLGDSGSLLLGFVLAVVSIGTSNRPSAVVAILVPMLALGLPLVETALTVARRLLWGVQVVRGAQSERYEFLFAGRPGLFRADRRHIHHRLLDLGVTSRGAVLVLYGICVLLGVVAFAIVVIREPKEGYLLLAFAVAAIFGVRRLRYGEMQLLRNGVLLPLFESPIVSRRIFHVLLDLIFILVSQLAALLIANEGVFTVELRRSFVEQAPLLGLVQISSFAASGLYRRSYRYTGIADLFVMLRALTIGAGVGFFVLALLSSHPVRLNFCVLDAYLLATLVIGTRLSFRILEHLFAAERDEGRRALVYGADKGGINALRELRDNPMLGMTPIGFLDDHPAKRGLIVGGCPVYGLEDLDDLIQARRFDELVVATTKIAPARLRAVAERCMLAGLVVRRLFIGWEEVHGDELDRRTRLAAVER